jgi:P27 family predicted phage terminase small subunit
MPRGSGRRPKPTALKKREGNPGKRRLNEHEPVAPSGDPEMPAKLPAAAKTEWQRILPELRQLGVLSKIDRAALAAYCHAFARWFQAEQEIRKLGIVVREPILRNGFATKFVRYKKNPAVTISEGAMKLMKSFLIEFGMTPAARSRLSAADPDAKRKKQDPAEKYFHPVRPSQRIQ